MNRNTVVVDGTKSGAPPRPAAPIPDSRTSGRSGSNGKADGRNGIVVWKANDVSIENLTACNFLGGAGGSGNEIWWNGGSGYRQDRADGLLGQLPHRHVDVLRRVRPTAAQYGIFASNAAGPGRGTSSTPATSTTPGCTWVRASKSAA